VAAGGGAVPSSLDFTFWQGTLQRLAASNCSTLVMESAEENLAQVLPSRALTPAEAREMLDSVLDVLAYLHSKGFVHGHIKPINIHGQWRQLKVSSARALPLRSESLEPPGGPDAYGAPENASRSHLPGLKAMSPAKRRLVARHDSGRDFDADLPAARTAKPNRNCWCRRLCPSRSWI